MTFSKRDFEKSLSFETDTKARLAIFTNSWSLISDADIDKLFLA